MGVAERMQIDQRVATIALISGCTAFMKVMSARRPTARKVNSVPIDHHRTTRAVHGGGKNAIQSGRASTMDLIRTRLANCRLGE